MKQKNKPKYEIKSWNELNPQQKNELEDIFLSSKSAHIPTVRYCIREFPTFCLLMKGKPIAGIVYKKDKGFIKTWYSSLAKRKTINIELAATTHSAIVKQFYKHFGETPMETLLFDKLLPEARKKHIKYVESLGFTDTGEKIAKRLEKKGIVKFNQWKGFYVYKIAKYKRPI